MYGIKVKCDLCAGKDEKRYGFFFKIIKKQNA